MNRILLKISYSKSNLAAGNILKERLLRMPVLMFNQIMNYGVYGDRCEEDMRGKKKEKKPWCPQKTKVECKKKPEPCRPKPCKPPCYACPPNDPPDHCPYKPPKCVKPCIPGKKKC